MKRNQGIVLFYIGVAILCAAILGISFYLRSKLPQPALPKSDTPILGNAGKATMEEWFPIARDLTAINQEGREVKLSDLKGKVWMVAEFFAVCPHCAVRNGAELRQIYDAFKGDPDFHIVCISVDPENDKQQKLADYASALGADAKNWWFLNAGEVKATHEYLEKELKFFKIRERQDPAEIEASGRYSHDLGFILVDRNFQVIGKWPLADARSEQALKERPGYYEELKNQLLNRIRGELAKKHTPDSK